MMARQRTKQNLTLAGAPFRQDRIENLKNWFSIEESDERLEPSNNMAVTGGQVGIRLML
jgi:hypothetical protein